MLYFHLTNITDEQIHHDVELYLAEQGYIGDYSDYVSHKLRIRESGVKQYSVKVTYFGVKDDTTSKSSKIFILQYVTEDFSQKLILIETQRGTTHCSRGRIWFGDWVGACR